MNQKHTIFKLVNDILPEYLAFIQKSESLHVFQAASQATTLFFEFLNEHNYEPSADDEYVLLLARDFLIFLQSNRAIETEHLYSRCILDLLHYINDDRQLDIDVDNITAYYSQHRRQKLHELPIIPFDVIDNLVDRVKASMSPEPDNQRTHLRFLRNKGFIVTLAETGIRLSEACNLRRYHISINNQLLLFNDHVTFNLSRPATSTIKSYLAARSKLDSNQPIHSAEHLPLFSRHDKRASNRVLPISRWTGANIIENCVQDTLTIDELQNLKKHSITITPHSFRHYFVLKKLKDTNKDIETVQKLARHDDINTTKQYLDYLEKLSIQDADNENH